MKRSAIRGLHVAIAIPDCAALHPSYNWPMGDELAHRRFKLLRRARKPATGGITMNGNRYYGIRVEGAKYGVGFGSALAIAISYTNNHSILWAIIHGILGWLYVIYIALFG